MSSPIHIHRRGLSRSFRTLFALAGLLGAACLWATPGSLVSHPSPGPSRVIGGASNGCVAGAKALPETGIGYVSVRRYRNRYYGHTELVDLIQSLGRAQAQRGDALMMVGDLSQPRGGRMPSSHRSHQNGLDADIWFTLTQSPQEARRLMDNRSDPQSMVKPGGLSLSEAWGQDQRLLLETAARNPAVDRIFVNPAIKRGLCQQVKGDRGWLRKVRPWFGHDAHFHVRLRCPSSDPTCTPQSAVPKGDGCGAELAWWFSKEARSPSKKKGKPTPQPSAPAACVQLWKSP